MFLFIGWLGTFLYLVGHSYISFTHNWNKKVYYPLNLLAATCLIFISFYQNSWQAVVINSFWAIISILLLLGIDLKHFKFTVRQYNWLFFAFCINFIIQSTLKLEIDLTSLGWISAFVFSAVYLLFSATKMLPRYYLLWNIFAAISLLPQLWIDQNWPVFGLEIIWVIISSYGAVRRFEQAHLL